MLVTSHLDGRVEGVHLDGLLSNLSLGSLVPITTRRKCPCRRLGVIWGLNVSSPRGTFTLSGPIWIWMNPTRGKRSEAAFLLRHSSNYFVWWKGNTALCVCVCVCVCFSNSEHSNNLRESNLGSCANFFFFLRSQLCLIFSISYSNL